jgi:hypothetical protein
MKQYFYVLSMSGPAVIAESDLSPAERAEWKAITDDYDAQRAFEEMEAGRSEELEVTRRLNSALRRGSR